METRIQVTVRRPRRGYVAATAVVVVTAATVTAFALAPAGTTSTSVTAPPGLTADGRVADVVAMSSSVTRMNGGATKSVGKTIGRVLVAKAYTDRVRISVAWLNPLAAAKVLNNPHAQLRLQLHYPTSTTTGSCSHDDALAIVEGSTTFCALADTGATGSHSVDEDGVLLIAQALLSGYLEPSVDGSGALAQCAADSGDPTEWCQPPVALAPADQRLMYIVASITVPGGVPHGQQPQLGSLTFFLRATRVA